MYVVLLLAILLVLLGGSRALGTFAFWFCIPWIILIIVAVIGGLTSSN